MASAYASLPRIAQQGPQADSDTDHDRHGGSNSIPHCCRSETSGNCADRSGPLMGTEQVCHKHKGGEASSTGDTASTE